MTAAAETRRDPGPTDREPQSVTVDLAERAYDVVIGVHVLGDAGYLPGLSDGAARALVVTQPTIVGSYAATVADALRDAGLDAEIAAVPDGENAKTLAVLADLYGRAAATPLGRRDLVVAVGGGAVGDLAGFLAATWNRGVAHLQVPTTLVGQVDAAIGGKTAVNLPEGKNLVGAFHQPVGVVADVAALQTLPDREVVAGLGEVVKYGLIRDPTILVTLDDRAAAALDARPDVAADLVARCVRVKAGIVAADERESGVREHLNFGHTFGHAVEALTGYRRYRHGEAVAIGMIAALELGVALGLTARSLADDVRGLLDRLGLPISAPPLDRDDVWRLMARDKKARGDVRFVVVREAGEVEVAAPPRETVDAALDAVEEGR